LLIFEHISAIDRLPPETAYPNIFPYTAQWPMAMIFLLHISSMLHF